MARAKKFSAGVKHYADPRKAPKVKAPKPEPVKTGGNVYRSRPTLPGPFGDDEPPFYGELHEVLARHAVDVEGGMAPVLEYRFHGCPWVPWRVPVMVEDLSRDGLAHQGERGWEIDPEGQRRIYEAMGVPGGTV